MTIFVGMVLAVVYMMLGIFLAPIFGEGVSDGEVLFIMLVWPVYIITGIITLGLVYTYTILKTIWKYISKKGKK